MKTHSFLRIAFLAVILNGFIAFSSGQSTLRVAVSMPMLYDPPHIPVPMVRLSINGKPPALFVLSSAAPFVLFIDKASASELGLDPKTGWVSLQSVHAVDILGNPTIELDIPAAYVGESNLGRISLGHKIVGIVGSNFFAALPVELNFSEKKVTLYRNSVQEILDMEKDKYIAIKLSRPNPEAWVHTVEVSAPGRSHMEMQVATGSWLSSLATSDLKSVELAAIAPTLIGLGRLDTSGGDQIPTFLGRLEWLGVGSLKIRDVPCLVRLDMNERVSRLGVDILALFEQVILDYRSGYLLIKRPQGTLTARMPGVSGLTLQLSPAYKLRVAQVAPRGAAERAGFQVGDEIVAVNTHPTDRLSAAVVQVMLDGYAGVPQRVQIVRDDKIVERVLTPDSPFASNMLEKPFTAMERGTFGFNAIPVEIEWSGGGKDHFLLVTQITSEFTRRAGLRVGDKIIAVNGRKKWDESELSEFLQEVEELRLTVMRPGETGTREVRVKRQTAGAASQTNQQEGK